MCELKIYQHNALSRNFKRYVNLLLDLCPWFSPTDQDYLIKCNDGTFCDANTHNAGWACCSNHRGKSKCPKNYPMMCGNNDCAQYGRDYCCDTIERCMTVHGGERKCEVTSKLKF